MSDDPSLIGWCACPDRHTAETIANHLVNEGLAACVTLLPGAASVYRWRGAIEHAEQTVLMIKTRAAVWPALEAAVAALHPDEVPELIAAPVAVGSADYLQWLRESTE